MKYYKLKISLENYEDKLNRTILFNFDNDLDELAFTVISIFNTLAYHMYMFEDDSKTFECEISLMEAERSGYPDKGFDTWKVTLDNLEMKNNKFIMTYDFGENYKFIIEVLDLFELKEKYTIPRVLDGVGYGIVEDDKQSLEDYLDGKTLNNNLLLVKRGRCTLLDFNSFDIEECNKKLKRDIAKIRNSYYLY